MEQLKDIIKQQGEALSNEVLKVDTFLNQQVDPNLMEAIAQEFFLKFQDLNITKVLTIESSGIAPAVFTAKAFNVPLIILKKEQSSTLNKEDVYSSEVFSFTKNKSYQLFTNKKLIKEDDQILFIDDFLANGQAVLGTLKLLENTSAKLSAIGIVIEKSFQKGRQLVEESNIPIHSLARIKRLDKDIIEFID